MPQAPLPAFSHHHPTSQGCCVLFSPKIPVVVDRTEEHVGTSISGDFSESEDEDNVSVGPQGGDEPLQIPTTSPAAVVNKEQTYLPRSASENAEGNAHSSPREEDASHLFFPMQVFEAKRISKV